MVCDWFTLLNPPPPPPPKPDAESGRYTVELSAGLGDITGGEKPPFIPFIPFIKGLNAPLGMPFWPNWFTLGGGLGE